MIRSFFSALAFLTVIPIPDRLKGRRENAMFAGYPGAGLLIGALLSCVLFGALAVLPVPLAAVVVIGLSLVLTGAIHLDGLADCADAFYGHRDRETTLRILKDPRIGTMGGAAIGLSLLARYAALTTLPSAFALAALPIAGMLSRTSALAALRLLPYVRGEAGILAPRSAVSLPLFVLACVVAAAAAVLAPVPTAAAILALVALWVTSRKKIGGCTGDVLGAGIEIAEIAFLLGLAAVSRMGVRWGGLYPILSLAQLSSS